MHTQKHNPLVFADGSFDRLALRRADEGWLKAQLANAATGFVPVAGEDNLLSADGEPLILDAHSAETLRASAHATVLLGECRGHVCFALGLAADATLPPGTLRSNLRPQFGVLEDDA